MKIGRMQPTCCCEETSQFHWCSVAERLEHLVLSVYCFPSYCLLTPVMSPKHKKCIIDGLLEWYSCQMPGQPGIILGFSLN